MLMASKALSSITLFLCLNLMFFSMASSHYVPCPPPPHTPKPPSHGGHPGGQPPPSVPSSKGKCPMDTLKLGVCANVLGDLLGLVIGSPPKTPCCHLIQGLADLEAALCLCTAIKANVLGIHLNVPLSLSLLLNYCGKGVPSGFQCP